MGQHADDIIEGRVFEDGTWTNQEDDFSRNLIQGIVYRPKNKFGKTKDTNLFGIYNFLSGNRFNDFVPTEESANKLIKLYASENKLPETYNISEIAEHVQKDFGKFADWANAKRVK